MEEKKAQPETPPRKTDPEINSILQSMMKEKESKPAGETALNNLKSVLLKADEAALSVPHQPTKDPASPTVSVKIVNETPNIKAPSSDSLSPGPIKELDALIRAHRAKHV